MTIRSNENFLLNLKGTQKPKLLDRECKISALPDADPKSVNHAFTLLSEKFETHRRSHTANVIAQVYYQNKPNNWVQINEPRDLNSECYGSLGTGDCNCRGKFYPHLWPKEAGAKIMGVFDSLQASAQ